MHWRLGSTPRVLLLSLLFHGSQQSAMFKNCLQPGDIGEEKLAHGLQNKPYKLTPGPVHSAATARPAPQTSRLRTSSNPRVRVQPTYSLPRNKRPRIKQENLPRGWMAWDMRPFFAKLSRQIRSMMSRLNVSIKSTLARLRSLGRKTKSAASPADNDSAGVTLSKISEELPEAKSNMPNSAVGIKAASSFVDSDPAETSLMSQGNPEKLRTSDSSKTQDAKSVATLSPESQNSGDRLEPDAQLKKFEPAEPAQPVPLASKDDKGDTSSTIGDNRPEPLSSGSPLPKVAVQGDTTPPISQGQEQQVIRAIDMKDELGGHPRLRIRTFRTRLQEDDTRQAKFHKHQDKW